MANSDEVFEGVSKALTYAMIGFGAGIFISKHIGLSIGFGILCGLVYGYRRLIWYVRFTLSAGAAYLCLQYSEQAGVFVIFFWVFVIACFAAWESRNDIRE